MDSKKEELELDVSEIEKKEQQTKPDCREVAVQTRGEATAAEITGICNYCVTLQSICNYSIYCGNHGGSKILHGNEDRCNSPHEYENIHCLVLGETLLILSQNWSQKQSHCL